MLREPSGRSGNFSENEKIGMVFSGVSLFKNPADSRLIATDENKQILDNKLLGSEVVDQFHMSQPLLASADLILALHDEDATFSEHSPSFVPCLKVKVHDGFVIFFVGPILRLIVSVVVLVILVRNVGRTTWGMHIRGIQDDAVDGLAGVRKVTAVHTSF